MDLPWAADNAHNTLLPASFVGGCALQWRATTAQCASHNIGALQARHRSESVISQWHGVESLFALMIMIITSTVSRAAGPNRHVSDVRNRVLNLPRHQEHSRPPCIAKQCLAQIATVISLITRHFKPFLRTVSCIEPLGEMF